VESVHIGSIPLLCTTIAIPCGQCTIQAEGYEKVTGTKVQCFSLMEFIPMCLIINHIHIDYLFIHLLQVLHLDKSIRSYNTKAMFHHKQFYMTYINSVNKPRTMINRLHKCKYYNRIMILFNPTIYEQYFNHVTTLTWADITLQECKTSFSIAPISLLF
jgi:hypothetical protein